MTSVHERPVGWTGEQVRMDRCTQLNKKENKTGGIQQLWKGVSYYTLKEFDMYTNNFNDRD